MKKMRLSALFTLVVVLMASCGGYPDHLSTLPKETGAVISFDLAGMTAKGDLDKFQETELYKKFQEELAKEDAEAAKETDEFLKNPLNYGINLVEPVYFFVIANGGAENSSAGFSIAVADAAKLQTFLTKTSKAEEKGYKVEAGTGYSLLNLGEVQLAWSEKVFVVLMTKGDSNAAFTKIFADKGDDESVVSSPNFKSFYKNAKDISGYVNFGMFTSMIEDIADVPATAELVKLYQGTSMEAHLAFNEDEIRTEYKFFPSDEMEKMYNPDMIKKGAPEKISKLVAANSLAVFSASVNLDEYLEMMKNNPALASISKEEMEAAITQVKQVLAPFEGDMLFTINDVKTFEKEVTESKWVAAAGSDSDEDEYGYDWDGDYVDTTYMKTVTEPVGLAALTLKGNDLGFLGLMLGKNTPKEGEVTAIDYGFVAVYATIKDKTVLVSNDKALLESINNGSYKAEKSFIAEGSADHGMYLYGNLNLEKYPKSIKESIEKMVAEEEAGLTESTMKLINMFDYVEIYANKDMSAVWSVKLKPTGKNSLLTLVESIGSLAYDYQKIMESKQQQPLEVPAVPGEELDSTALKTGAIGLNL